MGWLQRKWEFLIEPKNSNAVVAIFSGLLLLATIAYTVAAFMQRSTAIYVMREQQRPWMLAGAMQQTVLEVGKPIVRPLLLRNIGNTAAVNVHAVFRYEIVTEGDTPSFEYPETRTATVDAAFLWPQESTPQLNLEVLQQLPETKSRTPVLLTDEVNNRYINRHIVLVAYGVIGYDDIWGNHHWTKACISQQNPDPTLPLIITGFTHNECTRYSQVDTNR